MAKKLAKIGDWIEISVDGTVVEIRKAEVPRYDWGQASDGSPGLPMHRSWFEVRIDGLHVGNIYRPGAVGHSFGALGLSPSYEPGLPHPNLEVPKKGQAGVREIPDFAPLFVRWRQEGKAPTLDEMTGLRELHAQKMERERTERAEEKRRWKEESEAREAAALAYRTETREALEGIREKFSDRLTNFEVEALARALSKF